MSGECPVPGVGFVSRIFIHLFKNVILNNEKWGKKVGKWSKARKFTKNLHQLDEYKSQEKLNNLFKSKKKTKWSVSYTV